MVPTKTLTTTNNQPHIFQTKVRWEHKKEEKCVLWKLWCQIGLFGFIKREKQLNVSFPDFDRISEWTANICALFPAKAHTKAPAWNCLYRQTTQTFHLDLCVIMFRVPRLTQAWSKQWFIQLGFWWFSLYPNFPNNIEYQIPKLYTFFVFVLLQSPWG